MPGRLLAEAAAIVASILLAFSIDAWWDRRGTRLQEQEAIRALVSDFEAAGRILEEENLAVHDSSVVAAAALLEHTGPSAKPILPDSLAGVVPAILRLPYFRPPMGTLDALIGSGELSVIRNDSLRAALAAFPSALVDYNRTQNISVDVVFGSVYPYLSRRVPIRDLGLYRVGGSAFPWDSHTLLRDLEFENLVQTRLTNSRFALEGGLAMKERIEGILHLLKTPMP